MNLPLHIIRATGIYLSSKKAAAMVGKSMRWMQANRFRFTFRRKNKRNLEFELASILKVWHELYGEDDL